MNPLDRTITLYDTEMPLREWLNLLSRKYRVRYGEEIRLAGSTGIGRPIQGLYEIDGESMSVREWSDRIGIDPKTFRRRYDKFRNGEITAEQVIQPRMESHVRGPSAVLRKDVVVSVDGRNMTLGELSSETGLSVRVLHYRIFEKGMSIEEACDSPVRRCIRLPESDRNAISAASSELGLSKEAIYLRIRRGMSVEEATTKEKMDKTESAEIARGAKERMDHLRELSAIGVSV